ncbi:S9 family peptidase [Pseudoteredinibacter isoporae]|uniref:S9 family peptidase n=1 Tax=Pseudoteredinibacter isoporae TaxID=570281 RepID=UPI003102093D
MTSSNHKTAAPSGSWASPISASLLVADSVRLSEPRIYQDYNYWLEGRPQEKGRSVLVRAPQNNPAQREDLSPQPYSVRSSCHEYGGASYCLTEDAAFFVNAKDQDIYRLNLGDKTITRITELEHVRFADLIWDASRQRLIAVAEDHAACAEGNEPTNMIVGIRFHQASKATLETLFSGADFYSNPCLSPDGKRLSYLCWHHPNMPWDATECYVVQLDAQGNAGNQQRMSALASSDLHARQESIFQPSFGPDGNLYFVSDCNDWWNLYRYCFEQQSLEALQPMNAEFATPQWVFGMSCYGFLDNETLACCYTQNGRWQFAELDIEQKTLRPIESPYDDISMIQCAEGRALFFAANSQSASQLCQWHKQNITSVCSSSSIELNPDYISTPQPLSFAAGGETAHGFYYAPCNPQYQAMPGEKAPLIVLCHGGPTGATETALSVKIQFWTSRGFAVFDINYRGSTGYGRPYRDSLKGQWGIKDVEDVCAGAQYLVDKGLADPQRLCIKGGSAGGYTVLAALTFSNTFAAGASHYGIGDLETLARDTHKFEARYLDSIVGPYPDAQEIYQQRSPIHHVEKLNCPAIFFQGLEDKVVPPNQAEAMLKALDNKKVPVAYVPFEGEGHGFRGAEAIVASLEGELYFYSRLFDFDAHELQPASINAVNILNLEAC